MKDFVGQAVKGTIESVSREHFGVYTHSRKTSTRVYVTTPGSSSRLGSRRPPPSMTMAMVLNVVGEYGRRYSNADTIGLPRYRGFVTRALPFLIASYPPYTTTDHGKRVAASILFHPVWNELASVARALPSSPDLGQLRRNLDLLEDLKNRHAFHHHAPLSFDWTGQLYPDESKPSQPHITVDMHLEVSVEETRLSVPADHPPLAPASPDGFAEDGEGVSRLGGGAALNMGTLSTPNPLSIPPSDTRQSAISFSVLASLLALHTVAGEDLGVEPGDSPFALEQDGEEGDKEKVDELSVDRHLIVSRLGDSD